MSAREEIAAAASTVDGVSCSAYFRQSTKVGDAMVRLDRINYPNRLGGVCTWQVVVMLPADYAASEKYVETTAPALVEALSPVGIVTAVTPTQIALEQGAALPVLLVEVTRESDYEEN